MWRRDSTGGGRSVAAGQAPSVAPLHVGSRTGQGAVEGGWVRRRLVVVGVEVHMDGCSIKPRCQAGRAADGGFHGLSRNACCHTGQAGSVCINDTRRPCLGTEKGIRAWRVRQSRTDSPFRPLAFLFGRRLVRRRLRRGIDYRLALSRGDGGTALSRGDGGTGPLYEYNSMVGDLEVVDSRAASHAVV